MTWQAEPPAPSAMGPAAWGRAVLRGLVLVVIVFGGLAVLLSLRLVERPLCGLHRPVTPGITRFVCRAALRVLGIVRRSRGAVMGGPGAMVANHVSWLDIFALNACDRLYFVSKSEVAAWPGIGWLARATGTVFIRRTRSDARAQQQMFEERLRAGHRLLFFPEGTSTDGRRVLDFKPTLFQAFFAPGLREVLHVQPVTLVYRPSRDADPRFYGWWGEMAFGPHLLRMLAARRHGSVEVIHHPPLAVADFPDRKALARACEAAVRSAMVQSFRGEAP